MSWGDEIMHLLRHGANQSTIDIRTHIYGHIASYDPQLHRVRCIIPSMTDEDGTPQLSPWMPIGSPWQGAQYIYKGGASADNPNAGEQVMIGLFDRFRGVSAVPCTFYNVSSTPPATRLPSTSNGYPSNAAALAGGDVLIANPLNGNSPNLIRIKGDSNNIEIWGAAQLNIQTLGDVNAVTQNGNVNVTSTNGNATVTAKGTATIVASSIALCKALGDALQTLCTKALHDWAIIHVHGTGPPPSTPMPATSLTTVTKAE